jgi:hypothetical protein
MKIEYCDIRLTKNEVDLLLNIIKKANDTEVKLETNT